MKKLVSLFLSIAVALSLTIPSFASDMEKSNNGIEAIADTSPRESSQVVHYNAETGETYIEDGELLTFNDIVIPVTQISSDSVSEQSEDSYVVRGGIKKASGGKFTWFFNVDCPSSLILKPHIKLTVQLKGSFSSITSAYSNVGSSVYHEYKSNIDYGTDYTWTVPAKTGYYYMSYTLQDYDNNKTYRDVTTILLSNRTGHVWDFSFSDYASGKTLPMPRADYPKGATTTRPSNLADTYYKTYTANTGITLNRSLYDVHHIRPLAYGGSNAYGNLIHLPKATHTKVTGWWAGY